MRVNLLLFVFIISFSNTFAQIYSVGNDDGFSFNCYAQADNPALAIYSVGNDDGFSFNCVGSVDNEVPLPIELISFEAACNTGNVYLSWATASEINNDYFTIERSKDGTNWKIAGTVNGAGNSSVMLNYSFTDVEPYNEVSYYRLKQTDFDGKVKYFNLVSIICDSFTEMTIYPNPNTGIFIIEGAEQNSNVIITDMLGQITLRTKFFGEKTEIDLSNYSNGIYFIQLISEYGLASKKIIINK